MGGIVMQFNKLGSIVFEGQEFDSNNIRRKINNIKSYINKSFVSGEIVALMMVRDERLILTEIALLECNITFLPIDLSIPEDRVSYMIKNANVSKVIVSAKETIDKKQDITYIDVDEMLLNDDIVQTQSRSNNPAYILYTSGSTGNPKAVVVTYQGFMNFLEAVPQIIDFSMGKSIACFTSVSFDIFFLEAILGLVSGLQVVLANADEQNNPKKMVQLIVNNQVKMLQLTPSRLKMMMMYNSDLSFLNSVQELMIGGEKLTDELLYTVQQGTKARIYNMYGPTETTIWSMIGELTKAEYVDLGQPILNTHIYLLKNRQELVSDGEEGEICIAGVGLAEGYLNNTEQTQKNFIELPFGNGERIYCTGDVAKLNNEGKLIYIGRDDAQVKLRGYRIELEEIEEIIRSVQGVHNVMVCVSQEEENLVACYVADEFINSEKIIERLSSKLPAYMIPARYIKVPELIYTVSGKADRKNMLLYVKRNVNKKKEVDLVTREKLTDLEKNIIDIATTVFEEFSSQITLDTTLENMGVNSLLFIKFIAEIEERYDIEFEDEYLLESTFANVGAVVLHVNRLLDNCLLGE